MYGWNEKQYHGPACNQIVNLFKPIHRVHFAQRLKAWGILTKEPNLCEGAPYMFMHLPYAPGIPLKPVSPCDCLPSTNLHVEYYFWHKTELHMYK